MTVLDNLTYLKFSKLKVISNLHKSFRLGEPLNAKWIYIHLEIQLKTYYIIIKVLIDREIPIDTTIEYK